MEIEKKQRYYISQRNQPNYSHGIDQTIRDDDLQEQAIILLNVEHRRNVQNSGSKDEYDGKKNLVSDSERSGSRRQSQSSIGLQDH